MLKEFSVYRNGSSLPVNYKSEPQLTRTPLVFPLQLVVGVAHSFPNKRDFTLTAGVLACVEFEGGAVGGSMDVVIVCKLSNRQPVGPIVWWWLMNTWR